MVYIQVYFWTMYTYLYIILEEVWINLESQKFDLKISNICF